MNEYEDGYILTIDCGTQSLRGMIFDRHGHILAMAKEEFEPYVSVGPGSAEQDPLLYWNKCVLVIKYLKENYNEFVSKVVAITVTTLRDTGVFLDEEYKVIRPSLIWLDQRESTQFDKMSLHYRAAFKIVQMTNAIEATRRQAKTNWIREFEPEVWAKTKYYLLLSGFFHYKLTGLIVDSIGNQVGHIPFDYKKRQWPKSKLAYQWELFGIERSKLPRLVEPGTIIGTLSEKASYELGLPRTMKVIANGSDKGCETLGVGCLSPKSASLSFGTTATIQTTTETYMEPIRFMPSYPAAIVGKFNPEIQVFRGYWMIRWFKKEFAQREMQEAIKKGIIPEVLLNQRLKEIPPGSEGLILQPYWKPGLKNPEGKGAIIGFSDIHTRAHIYRAIIEGINFGLIDGLLKIEKKTKTKITTIYVSGGGANSDAICQITADMFNIRTVRGETNEAGGLGAAINGFIGLGIYKGYEEAVGFMVREKDIFIPDKKNAQIYHKLYERVYTRIYPKLKALYHEIKEILE